MRKLSALVLAKWFSMTEATLKALADHGEIGSIMAVDGVMI